ncbi:MAG: glycosyltransferase family 4 protein [Deltaproteobacteria bacterium]|nr:glycosyltransferase family 4 protein [Deltaproteobacteria bacterium]MBW2152222.1 glycosyltransferase family 4 protein [Deltaproteobacteria bacterium]
MRNHPGPHIALVTNTDWALYNFRKGLVDHLLAAGWTVSGLCQISRFREQIASLTPARVMPLKQYTKSVAPLSDVRLIVELFRRFVCLKPTISHNFTIKPVIYGTIAARLAGIPIVVNTITGLGYVFTEREESHRLLQRIVIWLYRLMGSLSDAVIVQNSDDKAFFLRNRLVSAKKAVLIPGSGVDTDYFSKDTVNPDIIRALRNSLQLKSDEKVVLCISRMLYDKGVGELVECARQLAFSDTAVRFLLVGPLAPGHPAMIPQSRLQQWEECGLVNYLGQRSDIRELLQLADLVVLPSYREGTSRVLLEAASMQKPIVATNVPGCRDLVIHRETGLQVPARNNEALKRAIMELLSDPLLAERLGRNARALVIQKFDDRIIARQTLELYAKLAHLSRARLGF